MQSVISPRALLAKQGADVTLDIVHFQRTSPQALVR